MQYDGFIEIVRNRRSIRKFKPDPIPDGAIEKMVEAARWAMSGGNAQPWEFIAVKNPDTQQKIVDLIIEQDKYTWDIERTREKDLRHTAFRGGHSSAIESFQDAPVFIVICGDPRAVQASVLITHFLPNEGGPFAHFLKNMANATQILHLAAASLGLGSMWVSVNSTVEPRMKALLDVPVELAIHTVVPVGYPISVPAPTYRREVKEILHYEKYDRAKYRSGDDIYNFILRLRGRMTAAYPEET